ncbi:MAG: glycosyltransferase family 39 protein [Lachnospiraceae bacterium]|nr:glycosyltransferase family 39 protein [Lachnospiraceae bacterium]
MQSVITRLLFAFIACLGLGFVMNQYHLPIPIYTEIVAVLIIVLIIAYYFAVRKFKEKTAFLTLVLINTGLFFALYIFFYEVIQVVFDYSLIWQFIIVLVSLAVVIFNVIAVQYHRKKKAINGNEIIMLISIFCFLFRTLYTLYNPITNISRQHDTIAFTSGGGHLGYIWHIWAYGKIPEADPRTLWEFYQPPLYYILCGYWVKLFTIFRVPLIEATENIQLFSLFCVTGTGIMLDAITQRLTKNNLCRCIVTLCFAICPLFTYLAGSVNNDALLLLLFTVSIYLLIEWYETDSISSFILLAVFTGLTVMTKISGTLIAVPILVLFVAKLINEKKSKRIIDYLLFGVISLPLGLWWNARNTIKFGMPFVYFHEASRESVQFIPNYTVAERLFDLRNQLNHLYIEIFNSSENVDHNIIVSSLKTMIFESSADVNYSIVTIILGWVMMILSISGAISALVMLIMLIINGKRNSFNYRINREQVIMLASIIISQVVFYLYFNFAHPFVHNMHIRYIMPALIAVFILISLYVYTGNFRFKRTEGKCLVKRIGILTVGIYASCLVAYIFLTMIISY